MSRRSSLPFVVLVLVRGLPALALLVLVGCGSDATPPTETGPAAPTTGWMVESPAEQGMDAAVLEGAREYAFQDGKNTQGVIVVRGGVIVAEWYEEGRDETSFATSWSVGKSFASALIGIAIEEGLIESVDVSMADYLPEWRGTEKEAITLRHVLSMASGLRWEESYNPADGATSDIIQMIVSEADQLAYAAARPVQANPGTRWSYSSGDTMLLSGVLEAVTGRTAGQYAREKLFDPLGMSPVDWWLDAVGRTATYCCIDTPSRQFAKFGLLYLRGGEWNGTQVVPADWVEVSTSPSVVPHYGYQWWLDITPGGHPVASAIGVDGQYIYVIPSLDVVVVRSGRYDKYDGPAQADPSLWVRIPSSGIIPGQGSVPPDRWSTQEFLGLIEASIVDSSAPPST